jgi:hypothetical protein
MSSQTLNGTPSGEATAPQPTPLPQRFWSRTRVLIAAAVALALLAGGAVFAAQSARAAAERQQLAALEQAQEGFTEASTGLSGALDAAADVVATAPLGLAVEEVTDAATVEALHGADAELQGLVDSPPAAWGADTDGWDTETLTAATRELVAHTGAVSAATAATAVAADAVRASHDAWVLDRAMTGWTHARDDLAASMEAARALLQASDGTVADAQTRFDLTAAIDAAQAVHDVPIDDQDPAALDAAATAATEHTDALYAVSETVSASQAQWRNAEDAKKAQQPVAAPPGTGKKAVNNGSAKGNAAATKQQTGQAAGGGSPGAGTGNQPAGGGAQEDNRSAADILGGTNCFATSSNGDTWTC